MTARSRSRHATRPIILIHEKLKKESQAMSTDLNLQVAGIKDDYKYGFHDSEDNYSFKSGRGLTRDIVCQISEMKSEPQWMRDFRLKALDVFKQQADAELGRRPLAAQLRRYPLLHEGGRPPGQELGRRPGRDQEHLRQAGHPRGRAQVPGRAWAPSTSQRSFITACVKTSRRRACSSPTPTRPSASTPTSCREYFGTIIPIEDNKFAALNSAVWSGGSFVYIPAGVKVDIPLQAYFRINAENMGQFERTLIIVEEGAQVHYVEGCTAPIYTSESLHSAVVEIVVKKHGRCRYTTIQNWANNIYNLVTKRAVAHEDALMEWVDGNLGSRLTMKYPSVYMVGKGARGEILSIAFAGKGQHQDAGGKVVHAAPYTSSRIISKSISKNGGRASYRGLLKVASGAKGSKSNVVCDALILDELSRSDTYPYIEIDEDDVKIGHEASVSKIGEEQLFYLRSRGLSEAEASTLIVSGFIEPLVKELPMEYAVEMNKLIQLQMEGSVG